MVQNYYRPSTLADALAAAQNGAVIAAGCTDLFAASQSQTMQGPVLDITGLAALRGVSQSAAGWRIGAATSWADIIAAKLPAAFAGLKQAAREVGSVQIQTSATIGGNLCNASPAADGVPALLVLEAQVELASAAGVRRLPLSAFLLGPRQTALAAGELLTAVLIPPVAGISGFAKLGARRYLVISIAMVAARLEVAAGKISHAALAVGACSAVAQRLPAQEAALVGLRLSGAAERLEPGLILPALAPIADIRADAAYRQTSAVVLLRRLLARLAEEAEQ